MKTKTTLLAAASLGALLALGVSAGAQAQDTKTSWKGAPQFQNDSLTFKVRGRTYFDVVHQDVNRDVGVDFKATNSRIRTARIGVEGTWNANWAYKAEVQFVGGSATWEDLILEYKPTDNASIMVGNFKTISLENITSSRYITFMERGAYNDIIDGGRVMNISAKMNGDNWTAAISASGDSINNADPAQSATGGSEAFGANARVTFAPILTDTTKLHLGAWGRIRDRQDQANFTYQNRNNTNYGSRYVTSGAIGVSDRMIGLEAALVQGPFSVQGEWANVKFDRIGGLSDDFNAFYVYGSWYITGESRNYEAKKGEFGRTKILNPVTAGGMGAFEVGVRYDNVDMTDIAGVNTAGEYTAWTVGLNWYPHPYVRFMANYTKAENDNRLAGADVDVDTVQFRAQFDF
jgi:phosphate-selective porin OprO/OprP